MLRDVEKEIAIQRKYYTDTSAQYDAMHHHEGDDDPRTLRLLLAMLRMIEPQTLLYVGAGTGRAVRHLMDRMPELSVRGVEPVAARITEAVQKKGIPENTIIQGVGESLPFEDASFDVVCCFAMLHHVPKPDAVVREILRVAVGQRRAGSLRVFISAVSASS